LDSIDGPGFESKAVTVLEGAKAGAAVVVSNVALKFDVAPLPPEKKTRAIAGADDKDTAADDDEDAPKRASRAPKKAAKVDDEDGSAGDTRLVDSGKAGKSATFQDDEDPYAAQNKKKFVNDEDVPLTERGWFWPTVIGGSVAGVAVLTAGTLTTLVAVGVLPDPRPASGASISITLPK
jgi:hypothetical protein